MKNKTADQKFFKAASCLIAVLKTLHIQHILIHCINSFTHAMLRMSGTWKSVGLSCKIDYDCMLVCVCVCVCVYIYIYIYINK